MPRPPRAEVAGGVYHVYARGAARQPIFLDDDDRRRYLLFLSRARNWMSWRCLTYCLMDNHVHLLIETPNPNLSRGMQRFHGDYAQAFNRRHKRSGHVFQCRFNSPSVETDAQLWVTAAYIVNNPVAAGLCDTAESWKWSSHAAIVRDAAPPWLDDDRLLSFLAAYGGEPRQRYAELVKGSGPLG